MKPSSTGRCDVHHDGCFDCDEYHYDDGTLVLNGITAAGFGVRACSPTTTR
jgi:hypothetical protein